MKKQFLRKTLKLLTVILFLSAIISCNSDNKGEIKHSRNTTSEKESIPDSVVQFLITSAANDFRSHQPPTPEDFRNVRIGYIKSANNEKIYTLCGEFLSKENKEWIEFATIKTSGYEQYIGKTQYCQDAIMVLTDENFSAELKNRLTK